MGRGRTIKGPAKRGTITERQARAAAKEVFEEKRKSIIGKIELIGCGKVQIHLEENEDGTYAVRMELFFNDEFHSSLLEQLAITTVKESIKLAKDSLVYNRIGDGKAQRDLTDIQEKLLKTSLADIKRDKQ